MVICWWLVFCLFLCFDTESQCVTQSGSLQAVNFFVCYQTKADFVFWFCSLSTINVIDLLIGTSVYLWDTLYRVCSGLSKDAVDPRVASVVNESQNHAAGPLSGSGQQVPRPRQATKAAGSQAGSHVVGERPWWGNQSHEERQMDGHATRPCCRSQKVVGPGQGATR